MSISYTKPDISPASSNPIYRSSIPEDFTLPSCGIEDVDRAIFNLFESQIPLYSETKGETKRIPVIFATGERAFVLRRNKPLTDKNGALILPLVSILRSGLDQGPTAGGFGVSPGDGQLEISRRKYIDSADIYSEQNLEGLLNQPNVVNSDKHNGPSRRNYRRNFGGAVINNKGTAPVTEIISIPSPRYFSVTYDITFWAQYLQQMNDMLEAVMSTYNINPSRSFRMETDKGYWFVGYVDQAFNGDLNFDSMTDAERIVKYNFSISVNGYIINPDFPGSQSTLRRTLSAPKISFDTKLNNSSAQTIVSVLSGEPEHYINQDLETIDEPSPGSSIGGRRVPSVGVTANTSGGTFDGDIGLENSATATIGGQTLPAAVNNPTEYARLENYTDPFTGETRYRKVLLKTENSRQGEQVHKIINLGD